VKENKMKQQFINAYIPFEYPTIKEYVPNILPSHEFKEFIPSLTRKSEGKFYALVGTTIYFGPFNSRSAARRAAKKVNPE